MTAELDKAIDVAIDKTDLNYQGNIRKFSQALIADFLDGLDGVCTDEQTEILSEAHRLFKEYDRSRGAIRGQVITEMGSIGYWVIQATVAKIRKRAGIGGE